MLGINTRLLDLIRSRRSIRRYHPDPVDRALIDHVLEAAIWAPSAHNRQPWRFAVVQSQAEKEALALAMGARLRTDLEADGVEEGVIAADVARSYERLTSAPVLIMVCLSMVDMDVYPDGKRTHNEYLMAVQSVAMAGQNLLLAAHDLGLSACWMCAPLFCPEEVCAALDLPEDWQPQGVVTLGYPAQEREKTRHPVETRVVWR
ncbi:MAG: nitroreductase family protein [bacterium]|nr:nitroreductase family protein [bacterium]